MTVQNHVTHPPIKQKRRRSPSVGNARSKRQKPIPAQPLIDAYNKRKAASTRFPPKITPRHLHKAMQRQEQLIEKACAEVEASCASCGEFKAKTELRHVPCDDERLHLMKSPEGVLLLDSCCLMDGSYHLCPSCFNALNGGNIPKFSAMNGVNVTFCEDFPAELDDLTLTEQYAIARSHPVGTILKLRPNGLQVHAAYNGIRGHIVTIPQNPGPLLDILPSTELQFHDHIKIVWVGDKDPTTEDFKPFVEVRKEKVIRALLWLCEHNPLYKHVQINRELINRWADNFIPPVLREGIVNLREKEDSAERGTYAGDMCGLTENDLHHALHDMADGTIASGAVYSDVEGERLNPELKMVLSLMELLNNCDDPNEDAPARQATEVPVVTWVGDGTQRLMNDYEDAEYFTGAFPTLFPYGRGGHIPLPGERTIPVSLEAWAKWSLSHHSRRSVVTTILLYTMHYLMYIKTDSLNTPPLCTYYMM